MSQSGDVASVGAVANSAGSPRVVGLDLSLTSTGFADEGGSWSLKPKTKGVERLQVIHDVVMAWVREPPVRLVVLEHYMAFRGPAIAIVEAHGVVKLALHVAGIPFAIVQPALAKKFATGSGGAKKDVMLTTAVRRFGFPGETNDEADAWILRCMGLVHLGLEPPGGHPITAPIREALAKVAWPDV